MKEKQILKDYDTSDFIQKKNELEHRSRNSVSI
jgi:hypothetical protein